MRRSLTRVAPSDFTDTGVIAQRLDDVDTCYKQTAKPFNWKLTTPT